VQVGEHDLGDRLQVDLLGDARLLLGRERADRLRRGVQAGVDEDPLGRRLDEVGGHGEAQRALDVVAAAHDAGADREPSHVEHLNLHAPGR
jgi:hypothetical protein